MVNWSKVAFIADRDQMRPRTPTPEPNFDRERTWPCDDNGNLLDHAVVNREYHPTYTAIALEVAVKMLQEIKSKYPGCEVDYGPIVIKAVEERENRVRVLGGEISVIGMVHEICRNIMEQICQKYIPTEQQDAFWASWPWPDTPNRICGLVAPDHLRPRPPTICDVVASDHKRPRSPTPPPPPDTRRKTTLPYDDLD